MVAKQGIRPPCTSTSNHPAQDSSSRSMIWGVGCPLRPSCDCETRDGGRPFPLRQALTVDDLGRGFVLGHDIRVGNGLILLHRWRIGCVSGHAPPRRRCARRLPRLTSPSLTLLSLSLL